MQYSVYKIVALGAEIAFAAVRASIPPDGTDALHLRRVRRLAGDSERHAARGACRRGPFFRDESVQFHVNLNALGRWAYESIDGQDNSLRLERLNGEQMMVAPRQMRGTNNQQSANITVCRHVAQFRITPRADVALPLQLGVAHA